MADYFAEDFAFDEPIPFGLTGRGERALRRPYGRVPLSYRRALRCPICWRTR